MGCDKNKYRDNLSRYHCYILAFPQLLQNFPLFTVPHSQVQSIIGADFPHSLQNLPVFIAPHSQDQEFFGAGIALPHSLQNLPVFV